MTPEQQMEQFSFAYVRAMAAAARVNVDRPEVDVDSVDLRFSVKSIAGEPQAPMIEAQVKAASSSPGRGTSFRFPLKVKNYRELIGKRYIPRILIVVVVPKQVKDWLKQDEKSLVLHRCGYWVSLAGEPETSNNVSVSVTLPRSQLFSISALHNLLGMKGNS
jgi:hypothetical protein